MVTQVLVKPIAETTTFAPTCGQCANFHPAREHVSAVFGVQQRPAYCRLLAQSGFDNVQRESTTPVAGCRNYLEVAPF